MIRPRLMALLLAGFLLPMVGGCNVLGYALTKIPGADTPARYNGLAGQRVAVMTWADRAAVFNYQSFGSDVLLDVSNSLTSKLKVAAKPETKTEDLKDTVFVDARTVYNYRKNHPEMESQSLLEVAPKVAAAVGATRLIYVELNPFLTRDPKTEILLKGYTVAAIRVADVSGGGAKIVYDEGGVAVNFPDKAPEGVPPSDTMTETYIYKGLVDALTTEVAVRFFSHPEQ